MQTEFFTYQGLSFYISTNGVADKANLRLDISVETNVASEMSREELADTLLAIIDFRQNSPYNELVRLVARSKGL